MVVAPSRRETELILVTIQEMYNSNKTTFHPGDIAEILRKKNQPLGLWLIRAGCAQLTEQGVINLNSKTSLFELAKAK
tara:strand:- start:1084 stop:1317 length:234 start_codon:yes stop_codon:yes gene_type:complete